jgi:hypothetical protein
VLWPIQVHQGQGTDVANALRAAKEREVPAPDAEAESEGPMSGHPLG